LLASGTAGTGATGAMLEKPVDNILYVGRRPIATVLYTMTADGNYAQVHDDVG